MSDIKLFRVQGKNVTELRGQSSTLEKSIQNLIEQHLPTFFGVRFLASEYDTGKKHAGRIDTLGLDENNCPVIFEYKRALNENVINQGLFYLDWLMDHQAEFKLLVMKNLGKEVADEIGFDNARLVCIAGDFTRYDVNAVQQMNRNIELVRYRHHGNDLILFDLVNVTAAGENTTSKGKHRITVTTNKNSKVTQHLSRADSSLKDLFEAVKAFLLSLGDDVQMKYMRWYIAFRRMQNFACVEVHPNENKVVVFVKVDPKSIKLEKGFTRDMREIGHVGTGDLEITLKTKKDLDRAQKLFVKSYEAS
jgi:predicted transport protein